MADLYPLLPLVAGVVILWLVARDTRQRITTDRKSTRLNSSH